MDSTQLLEKLTELDTEIQKLKDELSQQEKTNWQKVKAAVKSIFEWISDHWAFSALVVGAVLYWAFGLSLIEDIRHKAIANNSAEYYRKLGDKMMERAEFKAAEEAYRSALEINSYNIDARHRLLRVQVLQPLIGASRYNPVVANARLTYLKDLFKDDENYLQENYILPYWEGIVLRDQGNFQKAKDCFEASKTRNDQFIGSYIELGYTYMVDGYDVESALNYFQQAKAKDPNHAQVSNSIGYIYLVKANFTADPSQRNNFIKQAIDNLTASDNLLPRADTKLHLGDALRYQKGKDNIQAALRAHLKALSLVNNASEGSSHNTFELTFVFLPEKPGERRAGYVQVDTEEKLKIFILYAIAFDYALLENNKLAEKNFQEASKLDNFVEKRSNERDPLNQKSEFNFFFANKILSIVNLVEPSPTVHDWFAKHYIQLCQNEQRCLDRGQSLIPKETH